MVNFESVDDATRAALAKMFDDNDGTVNDIVLLDPKSKDIEALGALLGQDFSIMPNSADMDDNAEVSLYGIKREGNEDIRSFVHINNKLGTKFGVTLDDTISSDDAGKVFAEASGDKFAVYSAELVNPALPSYDDPSKEQEVYQHKYLGDVEPASVVRTETGMTVELGGASYDCTSLRDVDKRYFVSGDVVVEYDVPATEEAKKAAGWMTNAEKNRRDEPDDSEQPEHVAARRRREKD